MNNYVALPDIILEVALELGKTSLRKEFWDTKKEITEAVKKGIIIGSIGREVSLDYESLRKYIEAKKLSENIVNENTLTLKSLKELIDSMDKLTADEQLIIIKNRLKNIK